MDWKTIVVKVGLYMKVPIYFGPWSQICKKYVKSCDFYRYLEERLAANLAKRVEWNICKECSRKKRTYDRREPHDIHDNVPGFGNNGPKLNKTFPGTFWDFFRWIFENNCFLNSEYRTVMNYRCFTTDVRKLHHKQRLNWNTLLKERESMCIDETYVNK